MSALRDLVDLHCHLMPYVDDGAYDEDECLELLKQEAAQGVRTICLTPHLRADMFESTDEQVLEHFSLVESLVREAELPLRLYHSREYHYDRILRSRLQSKDLRPLGEGNTLLVEFGGREEETEMLEALDRVRRAGYTPLVAHVERCFAVHDDWAFAHQLRSAGALLQVNAGSILGREGLRQKLLTRKLLQKDLVTVIASDAHDSGVRVPELGLCAEHLENKYSRGLARRLLSENPMAILNGRTIRGE
jgi:protein-tyrosine phosphatase